MATSKVEVVVLGLLAEEPLYGYDLLERFRARSMGFWVEIGKASVYQALRRLERDGLIGGPIARRTGGARSPRVPDHQSRPRATEARRSRNAPRRWSRTRRMAASRSDSFTCSPPPTRAKRSTSARPRFATCSTRSRRSVRASPPTRVPGDPCRRRCSTVRSRSRRPSSRGSRLPRRIWHGSGAGMTRTSSEPSGQPTCRCRRPVDRMR